MKTWEQFYPFVRTEVIGCPNPVLDHALMKASREFCASTGAWKEWTDPVTASGTAQRFDFDLPTSTELVEVKRASVNGKDVHVLGPQFLPGDWQLPDTTYPRAALILISMTEYIVYPKPVAGDVITIQTAVQPAITATGVSDDLYSNWAEEISFGAMYRIQSSKDKPYTDLAAAGRAKAQFDSAVSFAKNEEYRQSAPKYRRVKKAPI